MSIFQFMMATLFVCAALSATMTLAWYVQQKSQKTGWVDVTWSFGVGGVALLVTLVPLGHEFWPHWRQVLVGVLATAWCIRLGSHIAGRARATNDDARYRHLIIQWGSDASRRMFWFLQSQAVVGMILALSIVVAARNPNPGVRIQDVIGLAVLLVAIIGEAVADHQLWSFKRDPANQRSVCDIGLWRWSRHPNYFFEWLSWLCYPIIAIDFAGQNSLGWLALIAPVCMYWILVHVSGIPPLEDHMLRSRGEAFRAYQRRTRPFFPFPIR